MKRFIEGEERSQVTLLPECLDDFIAEDNPVRVVDAFVEELDLHDLGFHGTQPADTGRPAYHPAVLLKIYICGYLNRIHSSRRLERECQRNVELMWLTGRLAPDFKTIADFRHDNGAGVRNVFRRFVSICRQLKLLSQGVVAVDGSLVLGGQQPRPQLHAAQACQAHAAGRREHRTLHGCAGHRGPDPASRLAGQDRAVAGQAGQAAQADAPPPRDRDRAAQAAR
jgi:transposase